MNSDILSRFSNFGRSIATLQVDAVGEVATFLEESSQLSEIIFCVFDDETHAIYEAFPVNHNGVVSPYRNSTPTTRQFIHISAFLGHDLAHVQVFGHQEEALLLAGLQKQVQLNFAGRHFAVQAHSAQVDT